jgi:hypothetical protein
VLKKYEQQRVEFVNEKAREAAQVRTQAAQTDGPSAAHLWHSLVPCWQR